jgi:hypothetical protein
MLGGPRKEFRLVLPRHLHNYSGGVSGPAHWPSSSETGFSDMRGRNTKHNWLVDRTKSKPVPPELGWDLCRPDHSSTSPAQVNEGLSARLA